MNPHQVTGKRTLVGATPPVCGAQIRADAEVTEHGDAVKRPGPLDAGSLPARVSIPRIEWSESGMAISICRSRSWASLPLNPRYSSFVRASVLGYSSSDA